MSTAHAGDVATITRVDELDVGTDLDAALRSLLRSCFADYPDRRYFKLPPRFRYLATVAGTLVGQLGVELRTIRAGDQVLRTLGVVDLCVRAESRTHGLAGRLLAEVTGFAHIHGIDFVVLFADDSRVYERHGWTHARNRLTWVKIHEHDTIGLATGELVEALMVKATGRLPWPDGDVDLLGHLF